MNISAIVYSSNTGFTRRYAQMLSRATAIPAYDLARRACLPETGIGVIYLGWLSAGLIKGLSAARRRWHICGVCAVGMSPENQPDQVARANHLDCPVFCLQGGYAPEKLRGADKLIMSAITGVIARMAAKKAATPEETAQAAQFRTGCDFVRQENLEPVIAWVREETKGYAPA